MSIKEILFFDSKGKDDLCPICQQKTLYISIETEKGFFKKEKYTQYVCDKCGCVWKVKE